MADIPYPSVLRIRCYYDVLQLLNVSDYIESEVTNYLCFKRITYKPNIAN